MAELPRKIVLLMADDDEDDCLLVHEAVRKILSSDGFRCLRDGQELMEYLLHQGAYIDPGASPRPHLILLDLNMPKKDGWKVLEEMQAYPELKVIPIVIFSTSSEQADIDHCYALGANSFVTKPVSFDKLLEIIRSLKSFWFETASLPL